MTILELGYVIQLSKMSHGCWLFRQLGKFMESHMKDHGRKVMINQICFDGTPFSCKPFGIVSDIDGILTYRINPNISINDLLKNKKEVPATLDPSKNICGLLS